MEIVSSGETLPSFVSDPVEKDQVIYASLVLVFAAGIYELADSRRNFIIGTLIAFFALLLNSFEFSENNELVFLLRMGSLIAFFGLLMLHVLMRMAKTDSINTNLIFATINGYLLIGLIGGMGFRLINHFYPHSFMFANGLEPKIDDLTYFSFITLSTLGYGDITRVTPPGQSLAIFLSICGQMYTAIVFGIIIGKFCWRQQQASS